MISTTQIIPSLPYCTPGLPLLSLPTVKLLDLLRSRVIAELHDSPSNVTSCLYHIVQLQMLATAVDHRVIQVRYGQLLPSNFARPSTNVRSKSVLNRSTCWPLTICPV